MPAKAKPKSLKPTPKVAAVAITGALVTAVFAVFHIAIDQPIAVLIAAVLSAAAGYLKSA